MIQIPAIAFEALVAHLLMLARTGGLTPEQRAENDRILGLLQQEAQADMGDLADLKTGGVSDPGRRD